MAKDTDHLTIRRAEIRRQIELSFATAQSEVLVQTQGVKKLAETRLRKALQADQLEGVDHGFVSTLRTQSRLGVNHKEYVSILAADMRGSTALAEAYPADEVFTLIQCFIPLLAFVVKKLNGEVIGLRGDGLIAAFGFDEPKWRPCINRSYEAGMMMIQAVREELNPFLANESIPTPRGMGVGVDCGNVTVTKIGLGDAVEVTAYGSAVNQAAKKSKFLNQLWMSTEANTHLHGERIENIFTPKFSRLV